MAIFREHEGFDEKSFAESVFGIDNYPKHIENHICERKPGWLNWDDVREYFGLGHLAVDPQALRDGFMSEKLYSALAHKIGKERLDKFFGKTAPKLSKQDQELEDLATLLWGTVEEKSKIRVTRLGKGNIK